MLERSHHLTALRAAKTWASGPHGGVLVMLGGEAGGGKTALVRRFCAEPGVGRVLWGACDPLFTPRPLGPFVDIAQELGGDLLELVQSGARPHQVAAAMTRDTRATPGTIVVCEDLHWADEATLDVLSLLGRRIESIPALVIATYRDDELDRVHPLRRLLGELRGPNSIRRLTTEPLTPGAVRSLAEPHGLDAGALHRATGGNPFFVTEVIAAREGSRGDGQGDGRGDGRGEIPATVREAVLARAARLSDPAAAVVEALSVALPHCELWLLDALEPTPAGGLAECLSSGIVEVVPGGVAFRHELARIAIEESLSPHRRLALHRGATEALAAAPPGAVDPTRLAYHAEAAGDTAAVLRFAPAAAGHAASIGAHREAAAQYERALRFAAGQPAAARATLLERLSHECYLTDQMRASVAALEQAIDHWRTAGDERRLGAALSQLARRLWCGGHSAESAAAGSEALSLLERLPPGPELALAYGIAAATCLNEERFDETLSWGSRALELAEDLGDRPVIAYCLNNLGTMELLAGRPAGLARLARSLALAEEAGLEDHVGRVFIHLGWAMTRTRAYDLAPWLDRGLEACEDLGLEAWKLYLMAYRARFHLDAGRWDAAAADAEFVLRSAQSVPLLRILALVVLALVRARRGEERQWPPLEEALALLSGQDELQYSAPVALARAEVAWLNGRCAAVEAATGDVLALAVDRGASWVTGELAWLRRLAGVREVVPGVVEPYAAQLAGDGAAAAAGWTRLGCPYDAALALVESEDESSLRVALAEFQRLGARPAAAIVSRRLREHGVRDVPRGPRSTTRNNPARLTRREAEVLALVQQGSSNAEIAARLYVSERTVHHHVSAILRKLGVDSRGKAVSEAARLGLTPDGAASA
ncbi:helix-turn-helix transcriptional regulator [Actinoplanes sp. ATCC 53533]|nr:helix-turn-helix transcriptional regulator [Actinoplanes sp. ATCC 53533]